MQPDESRLWKLKCELPYVTIRVLCSKGTYIRTLCHDIGQKLGCGAAMTELERTRSGQFTKENAYTLAEIERLRDAGSLDEIVMPVDTVFMNLPAFVVSGELEKKILNGNLIRAGECKSAGLTDVFSEGKKVRVYKENDNGCNFIAIYQYCKEKKGMIPDKMFLN